METTARGERKRIRVLVLNPGSATLKLALAESAGDDAIVRARASAGWDVTTDRDSLVGAALERLTGSSAPDAVGVGVVHGGDRYSRPVLIDADVAAGIERSGRRGSRPRAS